MAEASTLSGVPSESAGAAAVRASSNSSATQAEPQSAQPFRPLNVKDALSYLDRVKNTFIDQPDVYDKFLDIMKLFKAQKLETTGVIERVSTLFRGHPALIQGFNTFLPPGYRIECTVSTPQDDGSITTIIVTTPNGQSTRTTQVTATLLPPSTLSQAIVIDPSLETREAALQETALRLGNLPPVPTVAALATQSAVATPGAVSLLSSHLAPTGGLSPNSNGDASIARPPMEFNHAINYVNKIKNRFVRDPETYKAFLEILQTYQKEGKAIQDVYAQVTTLFHTAPDLLDEFKQFLPDTSADQPTAASASGQVSAGTAPVRTGGAGVKRPASTPVKKDDGSAKKPKPTKGKPEEKGKGKRITKPEIKDARKPDAPYADTQTNEQTYHHYNAPPTNYAQTQGYAAPQQFPAHQNGHPPYAYEPPPMPPPPQPIIAPKPQASPADIAFFQRAKSYIQDVPTYHEFLKLLNLYTQDIIDLTALVSRAFLFLGQDTQLFREFKEIVGWTEGKAVGDAGGRIEIVDGVRIIENVPSLDGPRRGKGDSGKGWKTYGPSYRQLPQTEISLACSGRDALCWDVLNDEWISQPSWASDEGFVAHKKNPFEEALHRSEEERHEYDYHIEANLRTIALLEPIATRIAIMEADERSTFRLKPGLGNQSKSIYQRVIKKVYGKEQGGEVIQVLHENPCVAVPIVLARLKQKDDEWKRALREWNRVWREVDAKNFWRSLDHQAITLKFNDKRNLSLKSLVSEIETIKREQAQRTSAHIAPVSRVQYSFDMPDRQTLLDAVKLIFSFLDRMPSVSAVEKDRVESFLRNLLPLIFAMSSKEFSLDFTTISGLGEDDVDSVDGTSVIDDSTDMNGISISTPRRGFGNKRTGGDLRKKALKNAGGPSAKEKGRRSKVSSPAPTSRATSPLPASSLHDSDVIMNDGASPGPSRSDAMDMETGSDAESGEQSRLASPGMERVSSFGTPEASSLNNTPVPSTSRITADALSFLLPHTVLPDLPELILPIDDRPAHVDKRRQWNFFANSNYFALLRLFQIVYARLSQIKKTANGLSHPLEELPISETAVPSISLYTTMVTRHAPPAVRDHHYQRGLILCEKLFDGEIDQATFEETLRNIFAIDGHVLFTIDKLLQGVVKTAQSCMTDARSQDLHALLVQDRAHPDRSSPSQQISYRTQAESVLGQDENLYRFEWLSEKCILSIQLVGRDSIAVEDSVKIERDWADYLERYVLSENTAGVDLKGVIPFLPRNLRKAAPEGANVYPPYLSIRLALQSKICMRSYRIFFVAGTEDVQHRERTAPNSEDAAHATAVAEKKQSRFDKWLEARKVTLETFNEDRKAAAATAIEAAAVASVPEVAAALRGDVVSAVAAIAAATPTASAVVSTPVL